MSTRRVDSQNCGEGEEKSWLERRLPESVVPFMQLARWDRPIGSYLLMYPGWWGICMATPVGCLPNPKLLALFAVGSVVMRGAGCTINDLWDHDIDKKVQRTAQRPLACGKVSRRAALAFFIAQSTVGLAILTQLDSYTIALGAISMIPVVLYPLAKRTTNWPQAVLGLTFNWGILCGYSSVAGTLDLGIVAPLFFGSAFWTMIYDTIYAFQDSADDKKIGLGSSALSIGENNMIKVLTGFTFATAALWELGVYNGGLATSPIMQGAILSATAHLLWQIHTADVSCRANLAQRFVSNQNIGLIMFSGISMAKYFA